MTKVAKKSSPKKTSAKEWIEIQPYGLSLSPQASTGSRTRPLLLFKDLSGQKVLPVWLNQVEAGLTLSQQDVFSYTGAPHGLLLKILGELKLELEKCLFVEVKGHHQMVDLVFKKPGPLARLRCRADEAMSFCLVSRVRFYCQESFFRQCQMAEVDLKNVAMSLLLEGQGVSSYMN